MKKHNDGHYIKTLLKQGDVKIEVVCPFPEGGEYTCGGGNACYVKQAVEEFQMEAAEITEDIHVKGDIPIEYWIVDDGELWFTPLA
jgi:hypothetical protein